MDGTDEGGLFTLNQGNRTALVRDQQMFSKETLMQIEDLKMQSRVHPCDMAKGLFYSFTYFWIVKNYLSCSCIPVLVYLPENG